MRGSLALLLLAPLLFAGCIKAPAQGLDTNAAPAPTVSNATAPVADLKPIELSVSTTGQYPVNPGFDPATLKATPGSIVHVTFTDAEQLPLVSHDLVFEKIDGAKVKALNAGEKGNVTFIAPAKGEYKYYCDIGDHRQRGMEGTLTVA